MERLRARLPQLNPQIWTQAAGRCLFKLGQGLLQFYMPLLFVNQVGLSTTAVGVSVGSASLSGAIGYIAGGSLADSQRWGRKGTLLLSAGLSVVAALVLALARDTPTLIAANLLLGIGIGFYWPAADASVTDVAAPEERRQAFALLGVAENLGIGAGIMGGGIALLALAQPQQLFLLTAPIFLAFGALIRLAMTETRQPQAEGNSDSVRGWLVALQDRPLWIFVAVNLFFTTYIALVYSTLPLYFTNFVLAGGGDPDALVSFSPTSTAGLFAWHVLCASVLQMPVVRALRALTQARALAVAMLLWGAGFGLVWLTSQIGGGRTPLAFAALAFLALATVAYQPLASSLVAELAPQSQRGVYSAVNAQCWTVGDFVSPVLGGWALDHSAAVAHNAWLVAAATTVFGLLLLPLLDRYRTQVAAESLTVPGYGEGSPSEGNAYQHQSPLGAGASSQ